MESNLSPPRLLFSWKKGLQTCAAEPLGLGLLSWGCEISMQVGWWAVVLLLPISRMQTITPLLGACTSSPLHSEEKPKSFL